MSSHARVISVQDFVRIDVSGAVDFAALKAIASDLAAAVVEHDSPRVLVDVREVAAQALQVTDIFPLVMHVRLLPLGRIKRIAVVNRPRDGIDRGRLFQMCARAQGLDVASFRDFEAALRWLNQETVDP